METTSSREHIELPVITLTPAQAAMHHNRPMRWLIAHQGWFFFPILLFEGLPLHASSVRRVIRARRSL